jgi:hypothetical protein
MRRFSPTAAALTMRAMSYTPSPSSNGPLSSLDGSASPSTIPSTNDHTRAAPWEPRGAQASRVLIGVVGAGLVGALAIGGVLLSPSKVPARPATGDQVAAAPQSQESTPPAPAPAQTADQMAAQAQHEPAAAGTTAPDPASSAAAVTPAPATPATDANRTQAPAAKPESGQ